MTNLLQKTIESVQSSDCSFCHFISPNDTGKTGGHQSGFYIPKEPQHVIFNGADKKGDNSDLYVKIQWQGDVITDSRFVYYGKGTRDESRITRFGKDFEWLRDDHVGDLLVISRNDPENFKAWILSTEEDIEGFLDYFAISPKDTNKLIQKKEAYPEDELYHLLASFVGSIDRFPETTVMANAARNCFNKAYHLSDTAIEKAPDKSLLNWVNTEYDLFKMVEEKIYSPIISTPFPDISSFVEAANKILNRRKSRAGKSLEHHLAAVFDASHIIYEEQVITEENKKPDFIFPNGECYHNFVFPAKYLVSLAAKTTCKDRWRQVINEANRIPEKHLFTLQQTISKNQLREMADEHVHLVVPHNYIKNYPKEYQESLIDLGQFVSFVKEKESDEKVKQFLIR